MSTLKKLAIIAVIFLAAFSFNIFTAPASAEEAATELIVVPFPPTADLFVGGVIETEWFGYLISARNRPVRAIEFRLMQSTEPFKIRIIDFTGGVIRPTHRRFSKKYVRGSSWRDQRAQETAFGEG